MIRWHRLGYRWRLIHHQNHGHHKEMPTAQADGQRLIVAAVFSHLQLLVPQVMEGMRPTHLAQH
jgi:hypothetical protein